MPALTSHRPFFARYAQVHRAVLRPGAQELHAQDPRHPLLLHRRRDHPPGFLPRRALPAQGARRGQRQPRCDHQALPDRHSLGLHGIQRRAGVLLRRRVQAPRRARHPGGDAHREQGCDELDLQRPAEFVRGQLGWQLFAGDRVRDVGGDGHAVRTDGAPRPRARGAHLERHRNVQARRRQRPGVPDLPRQGEQLHDDHATAVLRRVPERHERLLQRHVGRSRPAPRRQDLFHEG